MQAVVYEEVTENILKHGPSAIVRARRTHPYVVPFEELKKQHPECDMQLTVWDTGSAHVETNCGDRCWFPRLVEYCTSIRNSEGRSACIAYRKRIKSKGSPTGGSTDLYALFVNTVESMEDPTLDDPKEKSRMLGERRNSAAILAERKKRVAAAKDKLLTGKDLHCSNNSAKLRGDKFWEGI